MTKSFYTIFSVLAVSVIIYTGVDIFYRIVGSQLSRVPTEEVVMQKASSAERFRRPPLRHFQVVMDRNLFGSLDVASQTPEETIEFEDLEPTTLDVALLGTVSGSEQNAYAVILDKTKRKQGLYKVGDSLQDAMVKMILRERVILRVGEKDEILTMEESISLRSENKPSAPESKVSGSTFTVKRSEMQQSMENLNELMTQIRIRPHFRAGEPDGLSVSNIKGGSIFSKLGLRNGDIIQGVDGSPIRGPDDLIALHEKMKSASEMSVQVTRRNSQKTLNYKFR